jgi:hypothetical protein
VTARPELDERMLVAAVKLIGRTGATGWQLRYSDDEQPVIWAAVAEYQGRYEVAAALDPLRATLRLCERLIDGGQCTHCKRPTGFSQDVDEMPANQLACWYQWDPELATFRRGCEGAQS